MSTQRFLVCLFILAGWSMACCARAQDAGAEQKRAKEAKKQAEEEVRKARAAVARMLAEAEKLQGTTDPAVSKVRRKLLQEALRFYKDRLKADPKDPAARHEAARAYRKIGDIQMALGKADKGLDPYRQAIAGLTSLVRDFPNETTYARDLGAAHFGLGNLLVQMRRIAEAEKAYQQAIAVQQRALRLDPKAVGAVHDLGESYRHLAQLYQHTGRLAEAEKAYRQALALFEQLVKVDPKAPGPRQGLARAHNDLGHLLRSAGKIREAEEAVRRAIALQEKLAADFPAAPAYRQDLGESLIDLAALFHAIGRPDEAEHSLRKAVAIFQQLMDSVHPTARIRANLARALFHLARLNFDRQAWREARQWLQQAIRHQKAVLADNPRGQGERLALGKSLGLIALTHLEMGEYREAGETAGKVREILPDDGRGHFLAARILARCVSLAERDPKVAEEGRKASAKEYADWAMTCLRDAAQKGFKDRRLIQAEPDLKSLRSREDFRQLLKELEKSGKK